MTVTVITDLMATRNDGAREPRVARHPIADAEECGARAVGVEQVEHAPGDIGIGTVWLMPPPLPLPSKGLVPHTVSVCRTPAALMLRVVPPIAVTFGSTAGSGGRECDE